MFEHINLLAVFVSAVLALAVRSIWYSPVLFGPAWMRSSGISLAEEESDRNMVLSVVKGILTHVVLFALIAEVLAQGIVTIMSLWYVAGFLTMLFSLTMVHMVIWEHRSLSYLFIHTGYNAIIIFGGIGVLALWPW